jgi:hypothetical protein
MLGDALQAISGNDEISFNRWTTVDKRRVFLPFGLKMALKIRLTLSQNLVRGVAYISKGYVGCKKTCSSCLGLYHPSPGD